MCFSSTFKDTGSVSKSTSNNSYSSSSVFPFCNKEKKAHSACTLLSFGRKFECTNKEGNIVLQKLPSLEDQESRTAGHTAGTPTCQRRHSYRILDNKISKPVSN